MAATESNPSFGIPKIVLDNWSGHRQTYGTIRETVGRELENVNFSAKLIEPSLIDMGGKDLSTLSEIGWIKDGKFSLPLILIGGPIPIEELEPFTLKAWSGLFDSAESPEKIIGLYAQDRAVPMLAISLTKKNEDWEGEINGSMVKNKLAKTNDQRLLKQETGIVVFNSQSRRERVGKWITLPEDFSGAFDSRGYLLSEEANQTRFEGLGKRVFDLNMTFEKPGKAEGTALFNQAFLESSKLARASGEGFGLNDKEGSLGIPGIEVKVKRKIYIVDSSSQEPLKGTLRYEIITVLPSKDSLDKARQVHWLIKPSTPNYPGRLIFEMTRNFNQFEMKVIAGRQENGKFHEDLGLDLSSFRGKEAETVRRLMFALSPS